MRTVSLMRRASLYCRRCSAHWVISLFSFITPDPKTHHQIKSFFCRGFGMYNSKVVVTMTSNLLSLVPPHQLHIPVCPYPAGYGSLLMAWTHESLTSLTSSGRQMDPVDTNKHTHILVIWTFKQLCSREWHYDWGAVWKYTVPELFFQQCHIAFWV